MTNVGVERVFGYKLIEERFPRMELCRVVSITKASYNKIGSFIASRSKEDILAALKSRKDFNQVGRLEKENQDNARIESDERRHAKVDICL